LFTLDKLTGELHRVEKFDAQSGQHHELSDAEYSELSAYLYQGEGSAGAVWRDLNRSGAVGIDLYKRGYYQALADYEALLLQGAYLQGVIDCARLLR